MFLKLGKTIFLNASFFFNVETRSWRLKYIFFNALNAFVVEMLNDSRVEFDL